MKTSLQLTNVNRILCIGAHADDIEIGCGGTLLRWLAEDGSRCVRWVVFSGSDERKREAQRSADVFLRHAVSAQVQVLDFRDGYFPTQGESLKQEMHKISGEFCPDVVFTHRLEDRHQDHRLLAELTWNHFREQMILEYEIPKYDGDLLTPNFYVSLSDEICQQKVDQLMAGFPSQQDRKWFDAATFKAMLRLRGVESDSQFAEGFTARKIAI